MRIIYIYPILILILLVLLYTGCDDSIPIDVEIPESDISYSKHVQPVLAAKCISCHDDSQRAGGLSLTTWSNTTTFGIVVPGEPDNSRLVWSIEGRAGVNPMPPLESPYAPLTLDEIRGVRTWITEGALNN